MKTNEKNQFGKAVTGSVLLVIGSVLLAREFGAEFPRWLISWPMLLVVIGLADGIRHSFQKPGAYVLLAIGSAFLLSKYFITAGGFLVAPFVLIALGAWLLVSRQRDVKCYDWKDQPL